MREKAVKSRGVKRGEKSRAWGRKAFKTCYGHHKGRAELIHYRPYLVQSADKTELLVLYAYIHFDKAMWYIDNQWLGSDERGALDTFGQEQSIWSPNSRIKVAMKVIGGSPAITLECPLTMRPSEILANELAESRRFISSFDYLLAWRCGCPDAREVRYKTLDDIPRKYGYHDYCERCRCAPIEIVLPRPKKKEVAA
jgi:hypothetical protein